MELLERIGKTRSVERDVSAILRQVYEPEKVEAKPVSSTGWSVEQPTRQNEDLVRIEEVPE